MDLVFEVNNVFHVRGSWQNILEFWQQFVGGDDMSGLKKGQILQCGNFMIFLSLRFYVKSILEILQVQNLPFRGSNF